jgi:hypothetical protein
VVAWYDGADQIVTVLGVAGMSKKKWLDDYTGQTVDELIALEGEYRIDSLIVAFEMALHQKWARVDNEGMSEEEFVVLAIEAMQKEINSGGWSQFFGNTSREFTPIMVRALQRIGCPKTAEIAQKAVNILERAPYTEDKIGNFSWDENEERKEALNECDQLYFQRPENIEESLFAFINANRVKIEL